MSENINLIHIIIFFNFTTVGLLCVGKETTLLEFVFSRDHNAAKFL